MPAQQALTPQLVPTWLLQRALTLSASAMQTAIIVGPALGGLLYAGGPALVYATSAVLLLVAGALALTLQYTHHAVEGAASWRSVLAGVVFVWQHKVILGATTLDLFAVLLGGATALLPIFARDILETGPVGLGLLRGAPAAGALAMSLFLVRWPLQRKVGRTLLWAVAIFGLATVVFGVSRSFSLSLFALLVSGAADSISVVMRSTLVQLETPDNMRGRVSAVNSILSARPTSWASLNREPWQHCGGLSCRSLAEASAPCWSPAPGSNYFLLWPDATACTQTADPGPGNALARVHGQHDADLRALPRRTHDRNAALVVLNNFFGNAHSQTGARNAARGVGPIKAGEHFLGLLRRHSNAMVCNVNGHFFRGIFAVFQQFHPEHDAPPSGEYLYAFDRTFNTACRNLPGSAVR